MKNLIVYVLLGLIALSACNNEKSKYLETEAISAFDQMSTSIGEMTSVSYTLTVQSQNNSDELTEVVHDVYMRGPDKMYVYSKGENISRSFWYNGTQFAYFDYLTSSFDTLAAPETIMLTIDAIHNNYGVDFPAADFFYSSFTDDMIDNFDSILVINEELSDNEGFIDVVGINSSKEVLFSLSKDETSVLPAGFSIFETAEENTLVYQAEFSNWRSNPNLPDKLFNFKPMENSKRVKLEPKKQN